MGQLFFAGKAYLKINSLVKTPLHEFMAIERSGLWAPAFPNFPSDPKPLFSLPHGPFFIKFKAERELHNYNILTP